MCDGQETVMAGPDRGGGGGEKNKKDLLSKIF